MGQQLQWATVDGRFRFQVPLNGVVGLPAVGGTSMEDDFPLDGSGLRVPKAQDMLCLTGCSDPSYQMLRRKQQLSVTIMMY